MILPATAWAPHPGRAGAPDEAVAVRTALVAPGADADEDGDHHGGRQEQPSGEDQAKDLERQEENARHEVVDLLPLLSKLR